jgi:cytochrome c oxidase cbb3-type subunit III
MKYRITTLFLFLAWLWAGLAQAVDLEPMILTASVQGRSMDEVVVALGRAVVNHNYTFVRQQAIDSRLVPYDQEVRSVRVFYFCNFSRMDKALRLDQRAAQMMPCRITLLETPTGVDLMAVNPAWISLGMGNPALHEECLDLKKDYLAILEEATL